MKVTLNYAEKKHKIELKNICNSCLSGNCSSCDTNNCVCPCFCADPTSKECICKI